MRAALGESFYNVDVTPAELWTAVGRELQRVRLAKGWKPIDVERAGPDAPSYKTVQAIERGEAGGVDSLDKCARALGVEIVDVIYSVLESRVKPLSPEAALVVRSFAETTVEGRTAMLALARAVPRADATTGTPPRPDGEGTPPRSRRSRPVRRGGGRRKD